jgi:hypothetical protein
VAKVTVTGLEKQRKRIVLEIGRAIKRSGFEETLTKEIAKEVRNNGVRPSLASSTVKQRKYLAKHNSTHESYGPVRSNMTFTGQLLDSLKSKYISSKTLFNVDASKKKHRRYKKGSKTTAKLNEILDYLSKQGRDLGQIFDRKRFNVEITRKLIKSIQRFFR